MDNYILVRSLNESEFTASVNKLINLGYVPCGGVDIMISGPEQVFSQAMVIKEVL